MSIMRTTRLPQEEVHLLCISGYKTFTDVPKEMLMIQASQKLTTVSGRGACLMSVINSITVFFLSVTEIKALQDQLVMVRLSILGFYLQLRFHVGAFQDRNVVSLSQRSLTFCEKKVLSDEMRRENNFCANTQVSDRRAYIEFPSCF